MLGLALHESLPPHEKLSETLRAPLRSVHDDVRAISCVAPLTRQGFSVCARARSAVADTGWRVAILDAEGQGVREDLISFDLDAERAMLST